MLRVEPLDIGGFTDALGQEQLGAPGLALPPAGHALGAPAGPFAQGVAGGAPRPGMMVADQVGYDYEVGVIRF